MMDSCFIAHPLCFNSVLRFPALMLRLWRTILRSFFPHWSHLDKQRAKPFPIWRGERDLRPVLATDSSSTLITPSRQRGRPFDAGDCRSGSTDTGDAGGCGLECSGDTPGEQSRVEVGGACEVDRLRHAEGRELERLGPEGAEGPGVAGDAGCRPREPGRARVARAGEADCCLASSSSSLLITWISILEGEAWAALRLSSRLRSLPCRSRSDGSGSFGGFTTGFRVASSTGLRYTKILARGFTRVAWRPAMDSRARARRSTLEATSLPTLNRSLTDFVASLACALVSSPASRSERISFASKMAAPTSSSTPRGRPPEDLVMRGSRHFFFAGGSGGSCAAGMDGLATATHFFRVCQVRVTPAMERRAQEACNATSAVCEPIPYSLRRFCTLLPRIGGSSTDSAL
mmetsp:Transcript_69909/g.166864  ORF Transcript_69909/g.166864 Transcript_69909/m.166864 type:complete len:403 (+) Transcript_69909:816-2024(+)